MRSSTRRLATYLRGIPVAIAATLGIAALLVVGVRVGTSAAAAPFTWSQAIAVSATPPNAGNEPKALFDWGACPTVGSCSGVGAYTDKSGNEEAMAATRTNGSWGPAVEIALPVGAATSGQVARFGFAQPTVMCTGPGACVAVGHYITEGGGERAMVVTETGGVWGAASEIKLPANAAATSPEPRLHAITCPALGSCVAGGEYRNEAGGREPMVVVETGGVWGQASAITPPANVESNPASGLESVACSAVGSCIAIGEYADSSTNTQEAMVVVETGGSWGQASQLALPANAGSKPESVLDSAVCVASGPCVAVGKYTDSFGNREAMVAEESGGVWGRASEIALPANAASNPKVGFGLAQYPIACPASGACVITAKYTDSSGDEEAMVIEESGGLWGQASEIALPANAAGNPYATLDPACAASGSCVLVGAYTDEGGDREAMFAEGASGVWGQASEIAAPVNAETNPGVIFGAVQCPALGSCVAFGEYTNQAGATRDMEVTGMTAPENTLAPIVGGTAKVGQTLTCSEGTWTASLTSYAYKWLRDGMAIGGAESSTYTVIAADEGHSISCEVTATNALGAKSTASSNSAAVHEEAREKREAEEAAATKKRQEEEAALAAKKHQEQAKIAATSNVSLAASVIRFQSNGRGSVKLTCTGTAACAGKLTLTVKGKAKKGKKAKAETIGTAAFSIPAGKSGVVTITLTAAGRLLLKAGHGRLSASLTIVKSFPSPTSTERESVQLVQKKATKGKKRKR
jgi:hypothetical protein